MASSDLFEKWTEYFKSRIALLPANLVYHSDASEGTKSQKKERKRLRDQKRKAEFRRSFQPTLPTTQISIPFGNLSIQDRTNEHTLYTDDTPVDNEGLDREELKLKLHDKIDAIKVKSGTAKLKKKTQSERRMARMATKRKQERQIRTRKLIRKASKAQKDPPIKINNLQFTEFSTDPKQGEIEKRGNKSRKRKLAKSLAKAQKNKEIAKSFAETGEGGTKVLTTEWNHALQRASGGRVLDDPKKIKKTIEDTRKRKIRSAKAWEKRLETVEQQKQERQEKRRKNLKTRSEEKKRKKELRKAKKSGIVTNSF